MNVIKKRISFLKEENLKQEVLPQSDRFSNPHHKKAMTLIKVAKQIRSTSPKDGGFEDEAARDKRANEIEGKAHKSFHDYYLSPNVNHPNMAAVHKKKAQDLGYVFSEDYQTEDELSHKQKMMDYALKASERAMSDAKDFAIGKIDKNDKIQRRLEFIKKALKRVNSA